MKIVFTLLLMVCAAAQAQAQSVWRCGPDGRSYSSTPCVDGRPVAVADEARPASDSVQAQQSAARDKALAAQLVREREQREAKVGSAAAGIYGTRPAASAAVTSKAKPRAKGRRPPEDADTWRAVAPASRRAKG